MTKLVLMITFEKLQHQPFKFQKITSLVPGVCGIGRKGPWYLKMEKSHLLPLCYGFITGLVLERSLGKWQTQPLNFAQITKLVLM